MFEMKAKLSLVALFCVFTVGLIVISSCKKQSISTKPTLTFKSINATTFAKGDLVEIKMQLTDKEGDVSETNLFWEKVSLRNCISLIDTFAMPVIPETKDLDAELNFPVYYDAAPPGIPYPPFPGCITPIDDSAYFRFWLADKAGNVSDTIQTPIIILLKN